MFNTILFDLDGTISNSGDGITKCAQHALRHFGIDVPNLDELTCFVGPPPVEMFMKAYGLSREQAEEATNIFRRRYEEKGIYENHIYPSIKELLHKLKEKGKTVVLATSKPTVFAKDILERYGIHGYFDLIVGSETSGKRATKIEVMEEIFRIMEITGEQKPGMVMVGDRLYDVEGAIHCGIACIGVGYGFAEPGELQEAGADLYAPTVEVLSQLLLNN